MNSSIEPTGSSSSSSQSKTFSAVSHVVLDLDGTLIDTEPIYAEIYAALCRKYGKVFTEVHYQRLLGRPTIYSLESMIDEFEIPVSHEEFRQQFDVLAEYALGKIDLMPGAVRLIEHFHAHHIPMAIATNSTLRSTQQKLHSLGHLMSYISHIVTVDDVQHGKPSPDIYQLACSKFPSSPKPENCLAFEDSAHGLHAAIAANMQCVMIPDEKMDESEKKLATLVIKSLEEFKPELFGLPPFEE